MFPLHPYFLGFARGTTINLQRNCPDLRSSLVITTTSNMGREGSITIDLWEVNPKITNIFSINYLQPGEWNDNQRSAKLQFSNFAPFLWKEV